MQKDDYKHLHAVSRDVRTLHGISSILDWDQETYMPSDAASIRAEQRRVLAGLIHKQQVGRPFVAALEKLINLKTGKILGKKLSQEQCAALREWRRDYLIEKAFPKHFVEAQAKLTSQAMHVWHHAKHQNTYQTFAPFLDQIITMSRRKADLLGYKNHPYDALLDLYEPGMTTADVTELFTPLRISINKLIKKVVASQHVDDSFLYGDFPHDQQMEFGHLLLKALNYDMSKGRLDLSEHPFSSSAHPTDSRITSRIHPKALMSHLFAVLHEAGHSLYEMGLPVEHYGSPLGEARSLGVHESQSRWWETLIGHSKPFWSHFYPLLQQHFKGLKSVSLDRFCRAINKVKPSFIRIEADEVTYSMHVILRFELEKALIEGSLSVRDLPEAWNAKMQELLQITPQTNAEGCLQDIHWSMGALGYFPTYTLGNLYAAHLFQGFAKEHPNWQKRVAEGELLFIKTWLHDSVYQHGRRFSSQELLQKATGKPFTADAYVHYLTQKYNDLIR